MQTATPAPFSGSYAPEDISFLLRRAHVELTPVEQKEYYLQSGQRHYSDMLSEERAPSREHLEIYRAALQENGDRLARESLALAAAIAAQPQADGPIGLVSLVRAGCPLGVLLRRALRLLGRDVRHYGVSIIRDRGLDTAALSLVEQECPPENIYFVDGWTGKGAISGELSRSLKDRPGYAGRAPRLVVLADLCGVSWLSASCDDWLIPFGLLGAPVAGLVSRSLWAGDDLHKCMIWESLRAVDQSRDFVDTVSSLWTAEMAAAARQRPAVSNARRQAELRQRSAELIQSVMRDYRVTSRNRIKPGIAEATRALLRRVPDHVIVRQYDDPDIRLLRSLAKRQGVTVEEAGERISPYKAITIIRNVV